MGWRHEPILTRTKGMWHVQCRCGGQGPQPFATEDEAMYWYRREHVKLREVKPRKGGDDEL